jgi:hypothetical protein
MTLSSILAAKCRGLSEGSSGGGVRSLRRPLLNCPKTVCIVFCCSARIAAVLRNTTYPAAVKTESFTACPRNLSKIRGHRNSPNDENVMFL